MVTEIEEVRTMSDCPLHHHYEEWPSEPEQREALAREVFGEYIVAAYDGSLKLATDRLFGGVRYKSSTEEQRKLQDWIASLDDEERSQAFALVREMLGGVV